MNRRRYQSSDEEVPDSPEPIISPSSRRLNERKFQMEPESEVFDSQRPDPANDTMNEQLNEEANVPADADDVIKILVATDIHCGYGENKPVINMDAVNTFEEVLQIATEQKADMILLGGDLFHENNPSREVQHRVTQLLRQYCLNENPIALEFLSDASVNFNQSMFGHVNYYDQNLNVGLPIFTIHGNHDDLSGKGLTALDLLHEAGLVNLFGKHGSIQEFTISPILLRKGRTLLALYGLGSQRDDRLVRAFKDQKITFFRPNAGSEDWFNLFVLHQNRPRRAMHRSTGNYLPEALIPQFFDLLVWGHEHECKPDPQFVASSDVVGDGFYILQPGSTVATSLTHEEALQKNVFMIKIKGRKFASKPIPLQTVRPMVVDELVLDKIPSGCKPPTKNERPKNREGMYIDELEIEAKLNEMIARAKASRKPRQPELPLIRLKVIYDGDWIDIIPANSKRIGLRYENVVANAVDMIVIKKNSAPKDSQKRKGGEHDRERVLDDFGNVSAANLQTMINDYFANQPVASRMTVLRPSGIGRALEGYSEIDEGGTAATANRSFDTSLFGQIDLVRNALKKMPLPPIDTAADLSAFRDLIVKDLMDLKKTEYEKTDGVTSIADPSLQDEEDESQFYMPVEPSISRKPANEEEVGDNEDDVVMDSDEEPMSFARISQPATRARGRGSRSGSTRGTRGTSGTRGSGARGKAAAKATTSSRPVDSDSDECVVLNDSPSPPPPVSRNLARGRGRGKATAATKKKDLFSYF